MSQIDKTFVVEAISNLKEKSNNKIWGLIALFIATDNTKEIQNNITYRVASEKLSILLQDLFYFGDTNKKFSSQNYLFYRLSSKWISSITNLQSEKPNILDAAIFYYKTTDFADKISETDLVEKFIGELNIPKVVLAQIFSLDVESNDIPLVNAYNKVEILSDFKNNQSIIDSNETLSFDSPYSIQSLPGELKRAPFIQTLYSGTKIQELILLANFDLDEFYPGAGTVSNLESAKGINKIYYGAPGTGKSHIVNQLIKGKEDRTERITFHPEFDYASFVGGYKPTMKGDDIRYEFVPQAFTNIYVKAWNDPGNDYYLVIEEINRGNCAEIFGDIFQLLDRNDSYKITPSKELKEYLEKEFSSNENISGEKLLLPPNLNILATMNTSDQSLFPMDSAFKRRWNWEYIPINYEFSSDNKSSEFVVQLSDNQTFLWLNFIKAVNEIIKQNDNLGMDKCIGNYFIKPDDKLIELSEFINKAIFYLWNDVFKDEMEDDSIFKGKTTYEDFFPIGTQGNIKVNEILKQLGIPITDTST